jgi:DNA-binding CsgD family transcriptional regulator
MVLLNIKSNIIPKIRSISNLCRTEKEKNKLVVLEKSLNKITSPFLRNISSKYLSLTPREIEVADLIKDGKTSKEISEMLFLSVPTVNFHRKNIRKKMNIRKGKNLNSFLRTLQFR